MLIDMHVHTSPISACGTVEAEEVARLYIEAGFDGIVITNHFNGYNADRFGGFEPFRRAFADECVKLRKAAGNRLKVFMGAEVALSLPDCPYAEFLVYGGDVELFYNCDCLYGYTQEELFRFSEEHDLLMYQSHPFRKEQGHFPHDMSLVHGVEINAHPYFFREEEKVRALAEKHGLLVCCGSDFHYATQAGTAGMKFDCNIDDEKQLKNALASGKGEPFWK